MKKLSVFFFVFLIWSPLWAQKYSIFVPDIIFQTVNIDERTKLTFLLREELAQKPYLSIINRSTTQQLLNNKINGGNNKYYPSKSTLIEKISDTLFLNEIDFAMLCEINPNGEKWDVTLSLIDMTGLILEEKFNINADEKSFEEAIKSGIARINSLIYFTSNQNDNPYEFEEMVFIPGGPAIIGSFNGEPHEAPQRTVYVASFYIDKFEVTNSQYKQFVDATNRRPPENIINPDYTIWENGTFPEELANHPVVNVTWYDAKAYCEWKGKRLPTAIEWEKAARGPYGNIYPWGNEYFDGFANLYKKGQSYTLRTTMPVGSYDMSKSYYGVYDLAGNVWEWVNDTFPSKTGLKKLAKGGGWGYNGNKYTSRASYSLIFDAGYTSNCLGFRCAK